MIATSNYRRISHREREFFIAENLQKFNEKNVLESLFPRLDEIPPTSYTRRSVIINVP